MKKGKEKERKNRCFVLFAYACSLPGLIFSFEWPDGHPRVGVSFRLPFVFCFRRAFGIWRETFLLFRASGNGALFVVPKEKERKEEKCLGREGEYILRCGIHRHCVLLCWRRFCCIVAVFLLEGHKFGRFSKPGNEWGERCCRALRLSFWNKSPRRFHVRKEGGGGGGTPNPTTRRSNLPFRKRKKGKKV